MRCKVRIHAYIRVSAVDSENNPALVDHPAVNPSLSGSFNAVSYTPKSAQGARTLAMFEAIADVEQDRLGTKDLDPCC